MKTKILISLEILAVFAIMVALRVLLWPSGVVQWERKNLGWTYIVMLLWIGLTVLVILLSRRGWKEYGVSSHNWQTNLDIGMKAFLIRILPIVVGTGGAAWLGLNANRFGSVAYQTLIWVIALALIIWVLNHQKAVLSGRRNIISIIVLLCLMIVVALFMGKLSLVIVSTVVWQFIFSGFGEEFFYRGYFQSRLNQAFGRPLCWFGIQFGPGLIVASLLFGVLHAFNSFTPGVGFAPVAWENLWLDSVAGLFLGVIREKTGTLLAPGIAHGLPDAVGEPYMLLFGWV